MTTTTISTTVLTMVAVVMVLLLVLGRSLALVAGLAVGTGGRIDRRSIGNHGCQSRPNALFMNQECRRSSPVPAFVEFPPVTMHCLPLPLTQAWSAETQHRVEAVLQEMVDSASACFVHPTTIDSFDRDPWIWQWSCSVPAFGTNCQLTASALVEEKMDESSSSSSSSSSSYLVIALQQQQQQPQKTMESQDVAPSAAVADADWGWICTQLYENRERWKGLVECNGALREAVVQHYQRWPADPGLDAASAAWTSAQQAFIADHYRLGKDDTIIWKRLKAQGYVVIDWKDENQKTNSESFSLATTLEQQERLSEYYLHETTCQGDTVRTDRVHFLSRAEAVASGMEGPYDFLMGLAHYGNDHWHPVAPSSRDMQPIPPATLERPFTIPKCLQFAEYGHGDFYTAHSDNSLTGEFTKSNDPIRSNFRAYTCIMYMTTKDWDTDRDGGALRLYLDSQPFPTPTQAVAAAKRRDQYVDISPINGRLLVFDSRLVHSVQRVTSSHKRRRALTLWINQPNNSGVRGEVYY